MSDGRRIAFTDFWTQFDPHDNAFADAIVDPNDFVITEPDDADILVFGDFGRSHASFAGTKVHFTGENLRPRWRSADFCIGPDVIPNPRYLRLPIFVVNVLIDATRSAPRRDPVPWEERDFCAFVYSRSGSRERRELFDQINAYRRVESPGRFLNNAEPANLDGRSASDFRASKTEYLRRFRFTIACENSSHPGYTTEKLHDAIVAGTIPIYWGNPRVGDDFDERAIVNCHAFSRFRDVVECVRTIDTEPEVAAQYMSHGDALIVSGHEYERRVAAFFQVVSQFSTTPRHRQHARARALSVQSALADWVDPHRVLVARWRGRGSL